MDDFKITINISDPNLKHSSNGNKFNLEDPDLAKLNIISENQTDKVKTSFVPLYLQDEDDEVFSSKFSCNYGTTVSNNFNTENKFSTYTELNSHVDLTNTENDFDDEDDSDDCVIIDTTQEPIHKMPSPNDKRLNVSNIQNSKNTYSSVQYLPDPQYKTGNTIYMNHTSNLNTQSTPYTNNLQQGYNSNVNMQSPFPNYQESAIPSYDKIIQSFQDQPTYCLDGQNINNVNLNNIQLNNQNFIIDDCNVISMVPTNDVGIFNFPTQSFVEPQAPMQFREIRPSSEKPTNPTPNHYISNRPDAAYNYEKRMKFQQEMKRKRKREIRENRFNENQDDDSETTITKNDVLMGLTWRDGPASYWYNVFNFPIDENILNYKIKSAIVAEDEPVLSVIKTESIGDEDCKFSTWQLIHWEDDIIIDHLNATEQVKESNKRYASFAGWIPSSDLRNMAAFQDAMCSEYPGIWPSSSTGSLIQRPNVSQWYSVFCLENAQIIETDWVSKIITDPRNQNVQEPYLLELDLNNECIHFDYTNPQQSKEILTSELNTVYLKRSNSPKKLSAENTDVANVDKALAPLPVEDIANKEIELKKIKILNKITVATTIEEKPKEQPLEPMETNTMSLIRYSDRDPYAFARDPLKRSSLYMDIDDNENYEMADNIEPLTRHGIQHSFPATQLDQTFFPLSVNNEFLRHMHRTRLTDIKKPMIPLFITPQPIFNLIDIVKTESEQRQKICQLTGSGDLFFMRSVTDLSASTDHLVLAEYSEEHPPLMMQTGMASRIINYFKGHFNQPVIIPQLPYGDLCVTPKIPFLGQLSSNHVFQTLENNMFRAPIYSHRLKPTDFLVIIRPTTISIRRVNDIFVVGQQLPLMEVPAPNSKKANSFIRDFLQVQIIRMFLQSSDNPKRIRHDDIKALFLEQSDTTLKKRLRIFADYKKAEIASQGAFWVLKPEFQLPTEDELLELITPEQCCLYYSMMRGLCRLEDAGYNSKTFIQADPDQQDDDDDDGKESHLKIENEVKAAPWHTTKTFLDAQKNRCYLELIGTIEPTGCGEAFSYAKVSAMGSLFRDSLKPRSQGLFDNHKSSGTTRKKSLKGTDADLRKLTTKKACSLLKEFGISNRDFKKLKRWDIIDLVKQMSTQRANRGEEKAITRFARVAKMTAAGQEERYRKECQRIFNLQNQVLTNDDDLTTDDEEIVDEVDPEDDADERNYTKRLGKKLGVRGDDVEPNIFSRKKGVDFMNLYDNESKRYLCPATADNARAILQAKPPVPKTVPKALCIRRQVENKDGSKTTLCQTIPWSTIVKIYFKMHQEHKTDYLRTFCGLNKAEEEKKARKIQEEKIRSLKRKQNQKIHYLGQCSIMDSINKIVKMKKYRPSTNTSSGAFDKVSCTACGNKGHMRTNKVCPLYMNSVKKAIHKRPIHRPTSIPITPYPAKKPLPKPDPVSVPVHVSVPIPVPVLNLPKNQSNKLDALIADSSDTSRRLDSIIDQVVSQNTKENDQTFDNHYLNGSTVKLDECLQNVLSSNINNIYQKKMIPTITNVLQGVTGSIMSNHNDSAPRDGAENGLAAPSNPSHAEGTTSANSLSQTTNIPIIDDSKQNQVTVTDKSEDKTLDVLNEFNLVVPKQYFSQYSVPVVLSTRSQDIRSNNESVACSVSRNNSVPATQKLSVSRTSSKSQNKSIDYANDQKNRNNRRRIDPKVAFNHQLEEIYKGLLQIRGFRCFLHPVRRKDFPTYHCIVEKPMDLTKVRMKINKNGYETRQGFLEDIKLIYDNCVKFNGEKSDFTTVGRQMMSYVMEQFCVKERKLMRLEKLANPLMDDDDMVGLRYILEKTVCAMEEVEYARVFSVPVNGKKYFDYYDKVSRPMELQTIRANINADKYKSREDLLVDINQIMTNCIIYNGEDSPLTDVCRKLVASAHRFFTENEATFTTLETNLRMQSDDASGSHAGPSSCVTADHLSHYGEDHAEDTYMDSDVPSCKRQRLSDSFDEDKSGPILKSVPIDPNKKRLMADLELTDSDDEAKDEGHKENSIESSKDDASTGIITQSNVVPNNNDVNEKSSLTNKVRIMAILQLTDSEDDEDHVENISQERENNIKINVTPQPTLSACDSVEEDQTKATPLLADPNKVRILADLELTDSEDGIDGGTVEEPHNVTNASINSVDQTEDDYTKVSTLTDNSVSFDKDNVLNQTYSNSNERRISEGRSPVKVTGTIESNPGKNRMVEEGMNIDVTSCKRQRLNDSIAEEKVERITIDLRLSDSEDDVDVNCNAKEDVVESQTEDNLKDKTVSEVVEFSRETIKMHIATSNDLGFCRLAEENDDQDSNKKIINVEAGDIVDEIWEDYVPTIPSKRQRFIDSVASEYPTDVSVKDNNGRTLPTPQEIDGESNHLNITQYQTTANISLSKDSDITKTPNESHETYLNGIKIKCNELINIADAVNPLKEESNSPLSETQYRRLRSEQLSDQQPQDQIVINLLQSDSENDNEENSYDCYTSFVDVEGRSSHNDTRDNTNDESCDDDGISYKAESGEDEKTDDVSSDRIVVNLLMTDSEDDAGDAISKRRNAYNTESEEDIPFVREIGSSEALSAMDMISLRRQKFIDSLIEQNCVSALTKNSNQESIVVDLMLSDSEDDVTDRYNSRNGPDTVENHLENTYLDVDVPSTRIQRLTDSGDTPDSILTRTYLDSNRSRILVDLMLSDSDDGAGSNENFNPKQENITETTFNGSEDSVSQTIECGVLDQLTDTDAPLDDKSNDNYYRKFDNNCQLDGDNTTANVIFYISDDE